MNTFRCPKCGKPTGSNENFCIDCGQPLNTICPQCGNTWRHMFSYQFCPECGYDMRKKNDSTQGSGKKG